MNTRRTRLLLWLTTAALLASVCVVVSLHWMQPPVVESISDTLQDDKDADRAQDPEATGSGVDQASLVKAAGKDIRQRLFDPPVVVPKPPPPRPLPPIELISTILRTDGDHSAWVKDGLATRKIVVGDRLGPKDNAAVVQAITSGQLVIEHGGKQVVLEQAAATGGRR